MPLATLSPNAAPLQRLASAVVAETSDDWEPERARLAMAMPPAPRAGTMIGRQAGIVLQAEGGR